MTRARRRKIAKAMPPGMHPITAHQAFKGVRNEKARRQLTQHYVREQAR